MLSTGRREQWWLGLVSPPVWETVWPVWPVWPVVSPQVWETVWPVWPVWRLASPHVWETVWPVDHSMSSLSFTSPPGHCKLETGQSPNVTLHPWGQSRKGKTGYFNCRTPHFQFRDVINHGVPWPIQPFLAMSSPFKPFSVNTSFLY